MPPKAAPAAKPAAKTAAPAAKPAAKAAAPAPKAAAPKAAAPAPKAAAPAPKPAEKKPAAAATNGVYAKNWGHGSAEAAAKVFGAAGKVVSVRVRRGKFAQVWFDSAAAVKKAIDTFNGKEVDGKTLAVAAAKSAPKPKASEGSATIFVKPIFRESTTRKQVLEHFATAGKIVKLRTYRQNYAYIFFESAAAAQKALKEKNGSELKGKKLTVKASARSLEAEKKHAEHGALLIKVHAWKRQQAAAAKAAKTKAVVAK